MRLGIRADKVKVTGNIKFDQNSDESKNDSTEYLRKRFDITKNAPLNQLRIFAAAFSL